MTKAIGIFGGTFDPVHFGHLRTALELYQQLGLQEIRFLPCQQPVHKPKAKASPEQRLTMLKLAIAGQAGFSIDTRELERDTPSYMFYTLSSLKQELKATPLCLICSMDAFSSFTHWYRWQDILELAHIVVACRPPYDRPKNLPLPLQQRLLTDSNLLTRQESGHVYFAATTALSIASSSIRQMYCQGVNPRYLLPEAVADYIMQQGLYR